LRLAENYIAENGGKARVDVFTVGKRARDYLTKRDYHLVGSEISLGGNVKSDVAHSICERLIERFVSKQTDRIVLIYNSYVSAVAYKPVATQFLPLSAEDVAGEEDAVYHREIGYIFEPNAARVFEQLIPRYVETKIFSAMIEAMTSEHNARRIAMNSATENCQEMISSLTLRANKARQAAITKEILEIVGGAEALKG
ncbi:MAG: F0F1 ATP synthase subunit gamma, partial [Candidatus Sumerlaeota bacterium]|nr:F0F1 ATP synthase subunit gamma [Candidatus Sumerlaeota bacterium]